MTIRTLILKNGTGSNKVYNGKVILAGTNYQVETSGYLSQIAVNSDLEADVLAGDIVVNDGNIDLSPADAVEYIQSEIPPNANVPGKHAMRVPAGIQGQRPPSPVLGHLRYNTSNNQLEFFDGTAWRSLTNTGNVSGSIAAPAFLLGKSDGTWFNYMTQHGQTTNLSPFVVPYPSRVVAIGLTSKTNNSSGDIQFYINGSLQLTWLVRNKRYAYKSDFTPLVMNTGDRLSIFGASKSSGTGVDLEQVLLTVYLQITSQTSGEGGSQTL